MPLEITKEFTFDAAHRLPLLPPGHKCHALHGHTYKVVVKYAGELNQLGWVFDFAEISLAWKDLIHSQLDHKYLNDIPGLENPTAEMLSIWIFDRLAAWKRPVSVQVFETPTASATYSG